MRRAFSPLTWLPILLLAPPAPAVIVDRIAIVVGDKIVTQSELEDRIRLSAFQNHAPLDLSPASRKMAAQELIDQKLIEREMDVGRYPRLDDAGRKTLLSDYEKAEKSDAGTLTKALAMYGLTPGDLEDDLGRQSDLLTFLNLRFRPAVEVTDQDIQKYYNENILKGENRAGDEAQARSLNEMRAAIEQKLTGQRADRELDLWLHDQRKRTKIVYLETDLAPDKVEPAKP
jgi:parvulin-like peptidyl-prolyl isomerase